MNNKSIHDLFICKYNNCNRYFVEPVMLECGRSVCKEHAEEMLKESQELSKPKGTYTCKLCLKEHHVPTEGFLFNKDLDDVLKSSGHLSALQVEIKKAIGEFENMIAELSKLKKDPPAYLKHYMDSLKKKVNVQRNDLVSQIEKLHQEMISQIDKFEKECQYNLELNANIGKVNQIILIFLVQLHSSIAWLVKREKLDLLI